MPDRLILLAIDGLDWQRLRQGVQAGRLPHLARMINEGAHAELPVKTSTPGLSGAEAGMNSPTLWTTVATGQYYFQHGVYDFSNALANAENPPLFQSSHVRSARIWDVLSTHDLSSVVTGYYVTYPSYAIKGVMVSDMFGEVSAPDVTWPQQRREDLARHLGASSYEEYMRTMGMLGTEAAVREAQGNRPISEELRNITREILKRFTQLGETEIQKLLDSPANDRIRRLLEYRLIYPAVRDERMHRLFLHLLSGEKWQFATCYYRLIDFVSHGFWTTEHDAPSEFVEKYGSVVDAAYDRIDEWICQVQSMLSAQDRLLILSDHGFTASRKQDGASSTEISWENGTGHHAEPAVLIASGAPRRGLLQEISLLDIAPSILGFFGIPQADSLDGGPVPGLLRENPGTSPNVASYAYTPPTSERTMTDEEHEAVIRRLAALGYMEA